MLIVSYLCSDSNYGIFQKKLDVYIDKGGICEEC